MRTHLRISAALFLIAGGLLVAVAAGSPFLFDRLASSLAESGDADAELGVAALGLTGKFLTIGAAILAVPCLATGWGVLTRRRWARLSGLTLAAVVVTQVPVGTVIGIYVLWVLLSKRSEFWFDGDETRDKLEVRR